MLRESERADPKRAKVCVIGLGNIGRPTACYIHEHGFPVYGYDIDKRKTMGLNPITGLSEWSKVPSSDIYVVCVNTGWKAGKPDMANIFDVCDKIATKEKGKTPLVSIESTVAVGTCRKVARMFDNVHLVHVPHRFWSKDQENHGVVQERVIGAFNHESLVKARNFYESLHIPLRSVSDLEVAELIKITENAYRFVQIAFVEQLCLLCERHGLPFEEVRKGANTKWNVNLLEARDGIKGECLPKDIRYLASLGETPLLLGSIKTDQNYMEHMEKEEVRQRVPK